MGIKRQAAPLRQEAAAALRGAIVRGEFPEGARLVEGTLCQRLDVSRTVVREALRQLETEGLVSIVPNRGPEVASLTLKDAENLYEVRQALESQAGALFAQRASEGQCVALLESFEAVLRTLENDDTHQRLLAKDHYYSVLLTGASNQEIARILDNINARIRMLRVFSLSAAGRVDVTAAELGKITQAAAKDRDPEATRQACIEHVRSAAKVALSELKKARASGDHRTPVA